MKEQLQPLFPADFLRYQAMGALVNQGLDPSIALPEYKERPPELTPKPEDFGIQRAPDPALVGNRKFGGMLADMLGTLKFNIPLSNGRAINFDGAPIANTIAKQREQRRQNAMAKVNEDMMRLSGMNVTPGAGFGSDANMQLWLKAQQGTTSRDFLQNNTNFNVPQFSMDPSFASSVFNQYQQEQGQDRRQQQGLYNDLQKEAFKQQLEFTAAQRYGPEAVRAIAAIKAGKMDDLNGLMLPPNVLQTLITTFGSVTNNREDNAAMADERAARADFYRAGGTLRETQIGLTEAKTQEALHPEKKPPSARDYAKAYDIGLQDGAIRGLHGADLADYAERYAQRMTSGVEPQAAPVARQTLPPEIQALPEKKQQEYLGKSREAQRLILERLRQSGR